MYTPLGIFFFYHGHILQDLSHQLFVTGSQLFIFQEHYHLLAFIYLPCIIVGTRSSIFPSLPSPSSFTAQHPGVTSWNDGLCEAVREITLCSPLTSGCTKGHQNWHLIQPKCQGPARGNSPLRVRTGAPGRCPEKLEQPEAKTSPPIPVQKIEASFCHKKKTNFA